MTLCADKRSEIFHWIKILRLCLKDGFIQEQPERNYLFYLLTKVSVKSSSRWVHSAITHFHILSDIMVKRIKQK